MLTQHQLDVEIAYSKSLDYLVYLPPDFDENQIYPLMIFLHGSGERGPDTKRLMKYGPPYEIARGRDYPFIVLCPQCPANERWEQNEREFLSLLKVVQDQYPVDADRIYLTGFSMGAYGAWLYAWRHPNLFAALATVANGLRQADIALAIPVLKRLPCWVFHGRLDTAVPLRDSEQMVTALQEAGADVRFTVYEDRGHDAPIVTYGNPELYEWFLRHKCHAR